MLLLTRACRGAARLGGWRKARHSGTGGMRRNHTKFRSPIATRLLARTDTGAAVTVQLGRPRRRRSGEFECPYRVRGLGRVRIGRALGVDGVQALQLAFEAVRLELEPHAAVLTWSGELGEIGFPQYVPYYFGGRFRKRLEAMINRAVEREAQRLEHRSKTRRKRPA
jgi:hypothetical protein